MNATDLAVREPSELFNPASGEIVEPTLENAVAMVPKLRDLKRQIDQAIKACEAIVIGESETQGTKTLRVGGLTAKISGGPEVVWDVEFLRAGLLDAGCPDERVRELIREEVTYKVLGNVAKQLAGANPKYAEVIEAAKSTVDKPYRTSIS